MSSAFNLQISFACTRSSQMLGTIQVQWLANQIIQLHFFSYFLSCKPTTRRKLTFHIFNLQSNQGGNIGTSREIFAKQQTVMVELSHFIFEIFGQRKKVGIVYKMASKKACKSLKQNILNFFFKILKTYIQKDTLAPLENFITSSLWEPTRQKAKADPFEGLRRPDPS